MRMKLLVIAALMATAASVNAKTPHAPPPAPLSAPLAGMSFLVGHWSAGRGQVAETGGTSTGASDVTAEVGGKVLLRRDHTNLFDAAGHPTGSFEQIMMIYPDGGAVHAEYSDGTHIIHYVSADIVPGKSVVFTSAAVPNAPTFQLRYDLSAPTTLTITFGMIPPGGGDFRPIATGALQRQS